MDVKPNDPDAIGSVGENQVDFEEETGSATSGADEPIVSLRPLLKALGLSWSEPEVQRYNPIPRERAIVQVPTRHDGSDQAPIEVASKEDNQIGLDWREDDEIIYIPMRPIAEALGRDWPNARLPLKQDLPPHNEEPQERQDDDK